MQRILFIRVLCHYPDVQTFCCEMKWALIYLYYKDFSFEDYNSFKRSYWHLRAKVMLFQSPYEIK